MQSGEHFDQNLLNDVILMVAPWAMTPGYAANDRVDVPNKLVGGALIPLVPSLQAGGNIEGGFHFIFQQAVYGFCVAKSTVEGRCRS
jgi:hypothetical protein